MDLNPWLKSDLFQEVMLLGSIVPNNYFMFFMFQKALWVWVRFLHSINMDITVFGFPHEHFSGSFCFSMKEWVNLVYPMGNWVREVPFCLILLGSGFLSFKMGCMKYSLWVFSFHSCCHFFISIWLILGFRSVYGILEFVLGIMLSADLVIESALWFFWIFLPAG